MRILKNMKSSEEILDLLGTMVSEIIRLSRLKVAYMRRTATQDTELRDKK